MLDSTDKLRKKEPCRICGGKTIEFRQNIVQMYDSGRDKMTVYCYCTRCGHKGPEYTDRFRDLDEARDKAYLFWNRDAEGKLV